MSRQWMRDAACVGMDPELFFPIGSQEPSAVVRATCQGCPVREPCLTYSLGSYNTQMLAGVWAGLTEEERRRENTRRLRAARGVSAA